MPSIEFLGLMLAMIGAITAGAWQIAKSNYHFYVGMLSVTSPLLIFCSGVLFGVSLPLSEPTWRPYLLVVAIATILLNGCLSVVKDISRTAK